MSFVFVVVEVEAEVEVEVEELCPEVEVCHF